MSDITFEVSTQGAPIVNDAYLHDEDVALVYVDLASKYCDVQWTGTDDAGIPMIGIYASEHSLHLDKTKSRDDITELRFPGFAGWHVSAANSGRYTLTVVFTRDRKEPA